LPPLPAPGAPAAALVPALAPSAPGPLQAALTLRHSAKIVDEPALLKVNWK